MTRSANLPRWCVTLVVATMAAAGACGSELSRDATPRSHPGRATVAKIVDGDTIRVRLGSGEGSPDERVRLIGIDTPETQVRGGLGECFGAEASRRLSSLLPAGTSVRLVRDVEPRDRYGRLLAYVYRLPDELFVNLVLAQEGYASILPFPPNVAHADVLRRASEEAQRSRRGMWGGCRSP